MKKKTKSPPKFKPCHQNQIELLPPSLDELLPPDHIVRLVDRILDQMNIDKLLATYKGGGTTSYHPRMMLKVIVYAYTQKIYTSRRIAKALREQIPFMWLSGGNRPDFRTINRFRSSRLKKTISEVFGTLVEMLLDAGLVKLEDYFLDGTKIEANANRYSFVWKKSVANYEAKLQSKFRSLIKHIDHSNDEENARYGDRDLEELGEDSHVTSEQIEATLKKLEGLMSLRPDDGELKKSVKTVKEDLLPRQRKYERHREALGDRNSYSKTDPDATFMRMKDDHMKNGQLKPGYNIQAGVSNQFLIHYTTHQSPGDAGLLRSHFDAFQNQHNRMPDRVTTDAGYGSEENYEYLANAGSEAYVKYPGFYREEKRKHKTNPFLVEHLPYDEATDQFTCPAGKTLDFVVEKTRTSKTGYISNIRIYQCSDCSGCTLKTQCHKGQSNRRIEVNFRLRTLRRQARMRLDSDTGKMLRGRRLAEVESVFGQMKNRSFRRFILRGLDAVHLEFGLAAMAHNLMKLAVVIKKNDHLSRAFLLPRRIIDYFAFQIA